jgi:hypothetical protein
MLGDFPDHYPLEEKWSIVQAYKNGGGVAGLTEIIDHDDQEGQQYDGEDLNEQNWPEFENQNENDQNEVEIDLGDPEDIKLIVVEFQKLFDEVEDLKILYGEALLEIEVFQKYQVIDAYHRSGIAGI